MAQPHSPNALVQIALVAALAVGVGALFVPSCTGSGQLTPLMQCKLDALRVLPKDLGYVTVNDAIDIYKRVRACKAEAGEAPDGGAP